MVVINKLALKQEKQIRDSVNMKKQKLGLSGVMHVKTEDSSNFAHKTKAIDKTDKKG